MPNGMEILLLLLYLSNAMIALSELQFMAFLLLNIKKTYVPGTVVGDESAVGDELDDVIALMEISCWVKEMMESQRKQVD